MTPTQIEQRNNNIARYAIYDPELSLAAIGKKYRLSKQRISQILKELGIERRVVMLREQNRAAAYKEALKAARAHCATTLSTGKQRPEYRVYANMLRRCFKEKCPSYKDWGQRGITVCSRWLGKSGFAMFLGDMGPRPIGTYPSGRARYSIQRVNNDGNYEPDNCKWADQKEQCANRRKPLRK